MLGSIQRDGQKDIVTGRPFAMYFKACNFGCMQEYDWLALDVSFLKIGSSSHVALSSKTA
jgi:hypothetical protein